MSRNPLSIQVCFNGFFALPVTNTETNCRNPLSIQVCFNPGRLYRVERVYRRRNPLSIQVCFNGKQAPVRQAVGRNRS